VQDDSCVSLCRAGFRRRRGSRRVRDSARPRCLRQFASASSAHQSVGKPVRRELPAQGIAIVAAVGIDRARRAVEPQAASPFMAMGLAYWSCSKAVQSKRCKTSLSDELRASMQNRRVQHAVSASHPLVPQNKRITSADSCKGLPDKGPKNSPSPDCPRPQLRCG
jgi:hypothetical protein